MTFMKLEDITVLKFDLNEKHYEILRPDLLPLTLRGSLVDTTRTVKADMSSIWFNNQELISTFFYNRSLSVKRENAKYIMNQLHIRQNNDFESRYKAMMLCKALSVADNYWITDSETESWADVNLQDNPLHETLQQIALFGKSLPITGKIRSPEVTGQGAYAKAWYRENGSLYLYKADSPGGNECRREVLASDILDCFNVPHVKYTLGKKEDRVVCACQNMNFDNTSIVDSIELDIWASRNGKDFFSEAKRIDSEMFYKTIVADYLIANSDRHGGNWGFYMNNQMGSLVCMHPLFDHNNAFDEAFMKDPDGGICQLLPGKTQREAALYAISRCDFRCIKPVSRKLFFDEKMYITFMARACELGLYKQQRLSVFDRMFSSGKEAYVPVEIKEDNTVDFWSKAKFLLQRRNNPAHGCENGMPENQSTN
ncbi:HipA family kinase [Treponema brennaborense]|uniref:HipA domain protein n=1 Tax=Treponema brennaborense (strain DSM 12168 / CIP 105900 / DD5/3) TaxID=906968 RepID=F4LJE7_TREBD|nr:HipA family kinase [Treponema brennaborense]AEE17392.1 hypothetical protein Trebr_1975 [Treponema brennaborense DSM 12168]